MTEIVPRTLNVVTTAAGSPSSPALIRYGEPAGRWTLVAMVLGSGLAFIDGTVVNIALPRIGEELGADAAGLQWTVNGYTLTLAAFILLGGSLGDRFGRRRVFMVGVAWFALASLLCGVAPNVGTLVAARALQGVGGALLTPGALAILQASFVREDRMKAIGAWSGLGGIAGAVGPFLGGWLVEVASWRLVFLINLPLATIVLLMAAKHVPESSDPEAARELDLAGAGLGIVGLAGLTYGFTGWPERGGTDLVVLVSLAVGILGLAGFVAVERSARHPMLPMLLFRSAVFSATNVVTFIIYAALGGVFFFVVVNLQVVSGFSPLAAGTALLPVTLLMLLLSARAGALATRIGPRIPMTLGPIVCAGGLVLLSRVGVGASYVVDVLPAVVVFGLGLSLTVAPLTSTALAAADDRYAGVASGVNNAVARAGGLLAVAILPLAAGLGASLTDAATLAPAYRTSMLICATMLAVSGLLSFAAIPSSLSECRESAAATAPEPAVPHDPEQSPVKVHCAVTGPPLHPQTAGEGAPGSTR
ncbi:MAG: DHA2 family efflux MFS transporter permease subunit [Propionibacteriales bacterium]|nr:DHA2 family efflux MFS transporter permease subunit [Propionibacteriales bacterium]